MLLFFWEPPSEEGKSVEFPQHIATLEDCTTLIITREDCLICLIVPPFYGDIFAWNSLVCLNVDFFISVQVFFDALSLWLETSLLLLLSIFGALSLGLLRVKCLRLMFLLFRRWLPIFSQPSAALGCCTSKPWALSQWCRVMPGRRPLVHHGLSWIVPTSSAAFPPHTQIHTFCSHFSPFLIDGAFITP